MRTLIVFVSIVYSFPLVAGDYPILEGFVRKVAEQGRHVSDDMDDEENEDNPTETRVLSNQGNVVTQAGKKYIVDYHAEVRGELVDGQFRPQLLEFFSRETVYCDFVYANAQDYRFLMETLHFSITEGSLKKVVHKIQYDPKENDGRCRPGENGEVFDTVVKPDQKDLEFFRKIIREWN